ncbi:hypothetical protein PMIN02_003197 [Paraphaeosphaeria minitans]
MATEAAKVDRTGRVEGAREAPREGPRFGLDFKEPVRTQKPAVVPGLFAEGRRVYSGTKSIWLFSGWMTLPVGSGRVDRSAMCNLRSNASRRLRCACRKWTV